LDYCSTAELEDEIECLRQEGVTALTLDLRQLDGIDSPGAQVIAFQGALFEERGRRFAVIPGKLVKRALSANAYAKKLLVRTAGERNMPRFASVPVEQDDPTRSTTMIKHLVTPSQAHGG
jgi:hypothetical protein